MRRTLLMAALAVPLVAGCGTNVGTGAISKVSTDRSAAQEYRAALSGTPLLSIFGTPPDGATPEQVAGALRTPADFGGREFRLVTQDLTSPRIAIAFADVSPDQLCEGRPGVARAAELLVTAAFCRGTTPVASGVLRAPQIAGPSDPKFTTAVVRLMHEILDTQPIGGGGR